MTTYTIQALKQVFSTGPETIDRETIGFEYVDFTIVTNNSSEGFSYEYLDNPNPGSTRSFPEITGNFSGDTVSIDGYNIAADGPQLFAGQLEISGDTTYLLNVEVSNNDGFFEYIVPIGGSPLPFVSTLDEFNALSRSVDSAGPVTDGPFGPNILIPYASFNDATISEIDNIIGTSVADSFSTGVGDDTLEGREGDDSLNGGEGRDTAVYSGDQAQYTLTISLDGAIVTDRTGTDGMDRLTSIEFLNFETGSFDFAQFDGLASVSSDELQSFVELYIAYFNRAPDAVGLSFWGTAFSNGITLEEMASLFIDQDETRATYPENLSNEDFATSVYENVLGRVADQIGYDFWVGVLNDGSVGRDQFILGVLGGARADPPTEATPEFLAQQQADQAYLANKTDIGAYFAVNLGMSDVENATAVMQLFDGTQAGIDAAVGQADALFTQASAAVGGEFLMPIIGILDDPFA